MNTTIPSHVAIIMDGNRRWASERGLPVAAGHMRVADEVLEKLVEHARDRGIKTITFWAFSTENWNRSKSEVETLMRIFRDMIGKKWQRLHEKGVRIKVIGDISRFAPDIRDSLMRVVEQTKNNTAITAVFALNYGGRDEIIRAVNTLLRDGGEKKVLTQEEFARYLDTGDIPDPDFIIRTSGEQRLSGFLPWQGVYSELYFPSFAMPEFTPEKLDEAIAEYASRKRRFGK